MKNNKRDSIKERPPCKVTLLNEPNFELMAMAFRNLYYQTKGKKKEDGCNGKEKFNYYSGTFKN
jgi:hypothetical protein